MISRTSPAGSPPRPSCSSTAGKTICSRFPPWRRPSPGCRKSIRKKARAAACARNSSTASTTAASPSSRPSSTTSTPSSDKQVCLFHPWQARGSQSCPATTGHLSTPCTPPRRPPLSPSDIEGPDAGDPQCRYNFQHQITQPISQN